jgi:hypothetical protein
LDLIDAQRTEPFIYKNLTTERSYLVQNVQGGRIQCVLSACLIWQQRGHNATFFAPPLLENLEVERARMMAGESGDFHFEFIEYGIGNAKTIVPIGVYPKTSMGKEDTSKFLEVLFYDTDRYAALLPL